MDVLAKTSSEAPVLISNAEVMELLQRNMSAREEKQPPKRNYNRRNINKFEHRDWIEEQVHSYLLTTPCVRLPVANVAELKGKLMASAQKKQATTTTTTKGEDGESAAVVSSKPVGFGLTEAESTQILNFMPGEPVEIHLMIEELHGRMSEKRQEDLLKLVASCSTDGAAAAEGDETKDEEEEQEIIEEEAEEVHTANGNGVAVKREI
jgi:hypothetical protein